MINKVVSLLLISIILCGCNEMPGKKDIKKENEDQLLPVIDSTLKRAVKQYTYLSEITEKGRYPKTYIEKEKKIETSDSGWWCSGFFPGSLLYLDDIVGAPELKMKTDEVLEDLKKEQFNTTTHDLGFMMFCSFGNAERLNSNPSYQEILMNSARSLSTRYNDTVKAIRSWDSAPWNKAGKDDLVVIIDNMMNLELLFWATKHSNDSTFYKIAVNHANTTMQNHFREDHSSFHELIYDGNTGEVKAKITNQGASDSSSWARGQAWGLYGFVVMFRETKDIKYLTHAKNIADYLLSHPNLPEDKIPYWDFNAPGIPNALRDSSAGAIIASALLELSRYSTGDDKLRYLNNSKKILETLLTKDYIISEVGENGGFLLKHGVGNMPNGTEIDTPLSYGDYYLIEAMIRYLHSKQ
ncbi:glycoside hydrolase family 88 protein [Abyssalbus ytuae]|uniref:Glycoside hydrolase family 88 protein n=1 Tax=Abyssalbus ytuae TaxID=2926907 RepID=A0A9E6ZRN0_9FLAO|nr:glycoside hydrolase family 88 protein [Abyssalbus ytuae]UOB16618.1 glycoside hydrolase family 88 protein [Abyssalbus ytuae]